MHVSNEWSNAVVSVGEDERFDKGMCTLVEVEDKCQDCTSRTTRQGINVAASSSIVLSTSTSRSVAGDISGRL